MKIVERGTLYYSVEDVEPGKPFVRVWEYEKMLYDDGHMQYCIPSLRLMFRDKAIDNNSSFRKVVLNEEVQSG